MAGNDAVNTNTYGLATQDLTVRGSDWLWAVFAIMAVTDLVVFAWHLTIPRGHRVFHQLSCIILTTAAIAYFSMASALGRAPVTIEFAHANSFPLGTTRSIWYVRYIDWVITTPALLLSLLLASALPLSDIITTVFFDLVMIVTGLVGALVPSSYKWGFYTFGCVAMFYIFWILFGPARRSASLLGGNFQKSFTLASTALVILWFLYPIAWGLADGGNVITTDSEMIFYGILDVLAKPVWTLFHLYRLSKEDLSHLQLSSGKFTSTAGISAADTEFAGATAGTGNTSMAIAPGAVPASGHKKGIFGRRGQYDAAPAAQAETAPRTSQATAVSR